MQQKQFFIVPFVIYNIVVITLAVPIHYDQRQDGKLNVHAYLENVAIIIVPDIVSDSSSSSTSAPSQEPDIPEFSLSDLLQAFELRKNVLAKNNFKHKNDDKNTELISSEVKLNQKTNEEDYIKDKSLKTKLDKKKSTDVTELTLLGDSIENCGPGRFRDNFGICQFDGSITI